MENQYLEKTWDPSQYLKYEAPRLRPALDLLNRIQLKKPRTIYDLGCGAGNVTRILAERWSEAHVIGVDHSPEMLAKASQEASTIDWQKGDAATWSPLKPATLIYSNATLHWLPDHVTLFPHLLKQLIPDGVLAIQMPMSWHIPSHRLMREVLLNGGSQGKALGDEKLHQEMFRPPTHPPQEYYKLLAPRVKELEIWTTEYFQILEGKDAVLEWVKATGLRPILNGLEDSERALFLTEYRQQLAKAYPLQEDGKTLYPFPRIFIVARV